MPRSTSPSPTAATAEALLPLALGGEYPDQTLLELAVGYAELGLTRDALALLDLPAGRPVPAEHRAWRAYLPGTIRPSWRIPGSPAFQFPYRRESLPVLAWADEHADDWRWTYLHALNLWAVDRGGEAADLMDGDGRRPRLRARRTPPGASC